MEELQRLCRDQASTCHGILPLELLLRRVTTLRTAAEAVAPMEGPMESAPYGPPRVDPSLLRDIPLFSASVMLGEKTPEKGLAIGTPKRDTR